MTKKIHILCSLPRTIFFNFKYLPFRQAKKLPIWIANNVRIYKKVKLFYLMIFILQ